MKFKFLMKLMVNQFKNMKTIKILTRSMIFLKTKNLHKITLLLIIILIQKMIQINNKTNKISNKINNNNIRVKI